MDDGSYNGGKQGQQQQQPGGGFGQKGDNGDGGGGGGNKVKYTMPGVLHFIQHEWSNFELERSHWEIDRAELQASCCPLAPIFVIDRVGRVQRWPITFSHVCVHCYFYLKCGKRYKVNMYTLGRY